MINKKMMVVVFGVGIFFMAGKVLTRSHKNNDVVVSQHKEQKDIAMMDTPVEMIKKISAEAEKQSKINSVLLKNAEKERALFEQKIQSIELEVGRKLDAIKEDIKQKNQEQADSKAGHVHLIAPEPTNGQNYPISKQSDFRKVEWISDQSDYIETHNYVDETFKATEVDATPYLTIPKNATLMDAVTMTALVGRIPVNGRVVSPYPFKTIIGKENLASNGLDIPELEGIVASGVATGDMQLACVRGDIHSLTFTFKDGTISTTTKDSEQGLGYISTPNGNPCVNGKFYTNAHSFLAGQTALAGLEGASAALAESQMTRQADTAGGNTSFLTGSIGRFMGGKASEKGVSSVQQWMLDRQNDSFDAIYVASGQPIVLNVTSEINIDYKHKGRKVRYANSKVDYDYFD
jgi:hypothetical protein